MNKFSTFITENLITYLNQEDSYIQFETGMFELSFQKRSDLMLDWSKIQKLTNSLKNKLDKKFENIIEYCKVLIKESLIYESLGLDITIKSDLMQVTEIENIKIDPYKIYFITPKLVKFLNVKDDFCYNLQITEKNIEDLLLRERCSIVMLKNILMSLFSNNGKLLREQKQMQASMIEPKIIIDKNSYVIDGKHRLIILYLIGAKRIKCVEVDFKSQDNAEPLQKCTLDNIDALIDLEIFIKKSEINDEFYKFCMNLLPICQNDHEKDPDLIKRKILAKWISKIPLDN